MDSTNSAPNAMSVDVEDYFQVSAFAPYIRRDAWDRQPQRLEHNLHQVLEIFAEHRVAATFFWLGWAAERFPALVQAVAAAGHEVASHGWSHVRVHEQTPAEFRADVSRTKAVLEDLAGAPVLGYRAASFSIDGRNLWALDELRDAGYTYSSSINPISHDHYGMREAPRFPFRPGSGRLAEIPITTVEVSGLRLPCGGGGYFRLMPYAWSRWAIRQVSEREGQRAVFYFHPWEIDPAQPRVPGIGLKPRFRHYVNLDVFEAKLRRLLGDFRWTTMRQAFAPEIG